MRLQRLKAKRPASGTFERELAIEILKSDRLRITILICTFAVVLPAILTLAVFAFEDFQRIFHGHLSALSPTGPRDEYRPATRTNTESPRRLQ